MVQELEEVGRRVSLLSSLRKISTRPPGCPLSWRRLKQLWLPRTGCLNSSAAPDHWWGAAHRKCGHSSDPRRKLQSSAARLSVNNSSLCSWECLWGVVSWRLQTSLPSLSTLVSTRGAPPTNSPTAHQPPPIQSLKLPSWAFPPLLRDVPHLLPSLASSTGSATFAVCLFYNLTHVCIIHCYVQVY